MKSREQAEKEVAEEAGFLVEVGSDGLLRIPLYEGIAQRYITTEQVIALWDFAVRERMKSKIGDSE